MTPATFATLATLLRARSGLALGPDKEYLLESRLLPIARRDGLTNLDDLAARLRGADAETLAGAVVEAMTTNETFFFRDARPFAHLRDLALPALVAARPPGAPLRIWSAAASTGQEAYSLAMLMAEQRPLLGPRRIEILGTDLAREPLLRARAGLYSHFEVQRGLPAHMLARHFRKEEPGWRINQSLRDAVRFQELNLLNDLSCLGPFDIVFLRNVMIYFDTPTKIRVLESTAQQMPPGSTLYLGGAETALGLTTAFTPHGHCAFSRA